ncbi:MAG: tetratricopeptide repeat protein [Chloroflexota bacterium]
MDDPISILAQELEMAIRWDRPSVLFCVYRSELVRQEAENALQRRIAELGQETVQLRADAHRFDIPLILASDPRRSSVVFYLSGLRWGGGRWGANAYRALNMRREFFVDHRLRAVLWLTIDEARSLPRRAPDFWAFRHRVIDLTGVPVRPVGVEAFERLDLGGWRLSADQASRADVIRATERRLAGMHNIASSPVALVEELYSLAGLHWLSKDADRALELVDKGLKLAPSLNDPCREAELWAGRGIIQHSLGRLGEAVTAYEKASALHPRYATPFCNLSVLFRSQAKYEEALAASRRGIELDPLSANAWNNHGNVSQDYGYLEDAVSAYLNATRLEPGDFGQWCNLGRVYLSISRPGQAIRAFRKASRLDENAAAPWRTLGNIYAQQGKRRQAREVYRRLLSIDPDAADAKDYLGHKGQQDGTQAEMIV